MTTLAKPRWDRETLLVGGLAGAASLLSFLVYFHYNAILLYGDAVAHINIARRVFDSRTPGLLQLGTVWLPLPHLLMIPFLLWDWAWRTGVGGSIPSLVAYVAGVMGIFRLVRGAFHLDSEPDHASRIAAWLAAMIYAANPNLVYLQTTAMTETLYLAFFAWTVVFFSEFVRGAFEEDQTERRAGARALLKCGLCAAGGALTRYDGWFLAAVMILIAAVCVSKAPTLRPRLGWSLGAFILLAAIAPVGWLVYNGTIYGNPLEFADGPYSARAIEQKTARPGYPPHPGARNLEAARAYFFKSAEINVAAPKWQKVWVVLLLAGSVMAVPFGRRLRPLLLLWLPLPFYVLSIAYGGVPIFLPVWWPFSYYNLRYGLQLLPAFAVFIACLTYFLVRFVPGVVGKTVIALPIFALVVASYAGVWRAQPVCVREAWANSRSRVALESQLADHLQALPSDATLLMYLGDHAGAVQRAGIPLRRVIYEGNHRTWIRPSDPQGLWERALAAPADLAAYALAIDGDPVWAALHDRGLLPVARIEVPGQPAATIYQTKPADGNLPR